MVESSSPFLQAIRARRAELAHQRETIEREDGELAIAERVAERLEPAVQASPSIGGMALAATGAAIAAGAVGFVAGIAVAARPLTQTEMVIGTLKASAEPWIESSGALHDEILRIHGVDIKSGSLLPLLTSLKNDGVVLRNGPKIALAERVRAIDVNPRTGRPMSWCDDEE